MGRKEKLSKEFKIKIVKRYKVRESALKSADEYDIHEDIISIL